MKRDEQNKTKKKTLIHKKTSCTLQDTDKQNKTKTVIIRKNKENTQRKKVIKITSIQKKKN